MKIQAAICHSDIIYMDGGWGGPVPAIYGHEASGRVAAYGANVSGFNIGDKVVVTLIQACGSCHYCNGGHTVQCSESLEGTTETTLTTNTGRAISKGMATGAFAEKALVHESQICKIPEEFDLDLASLLACGVITGLGAVFNTAKLVPGSHAAIIGAGGVGLNAVQGAALAGAGTVTAIDIEPAKLDAAKTFGATHGINAMSDAMKEEVAAITNGRGFDYVFVTVGAKAVMDRALDHLAFGGSAVIVGMTPSGVLAEYDPGNFAYMSQKILGSRMGGARIDRDIPMLVELYKQRRLKLGELVTGRYALADINDALASARSGAALRNVVLMPKYEELNR